MMGHYAISAGAARDGDSVVAQDGATRADWPHYGGTQLSWRYSALDQVNTGNVKNLVPVWMFQTGDYAENLQATPIVVDGVMYLITPRIRVFALDAATRPPAVAVQISDAAGRASRAA